MPNRLDVLLFVKVGCTAMTIHRRFAGCLVGLLLGAVLMLPASAAELPLPPIHQAVTVAPAKAPVRHRLIKIASTESLPGPGCGLRCFIIVVGVAY